MYKLSRTILFTTALACVSAVPAATINPKPAPGMPTGLVIYNADLALVSQHFKPALPAGESELAFTTTSPLINPASAVLYPLPDAVKVQDQYFRAALTPEALLAGSVGSMVSLRSVHPVSGEQTLQRARVVSATGGLILEVQGRYETSLAGRQVIYDALPPEGAGPVLNIRVNSAANIQPELTLSYLTAGLSWQADYVGRLNPAQDSLQLQAMASIENRSGMDYRASQIELIAGIVNRAQDSLELRSRAPVLAMESSRESAPVSVAGLYRYALPRVLDVASNSVRQVVLFEKRDIRVERKYELNGGAELYYSANMPEQDLPVERILQVQNDADHGLGLPMPAGVVRVYGQSEPTPGTPYFIGEDRIGHVSRGSMVRIKLGKAFDIRARRVQQAFHRLPVEAPYRQHSETKLKITLVNAGKSAAMVRVKENFAGEWRMVDGPPPVEDDAHSAAWDVKVPAQGESVLQLTVSVKR